jgi:SNF2 family DNA or RNA helicase
LNGKKIAWRKCSRNLIQCVRLHPRYRLCSENWKNRRSGGDRIRQTVLFSRFLDSITSIREYLSIRSPRMRVGIFSGQQAKYYDPAQHKDRSITHEEIKRLFLAGEIDLLLCTDAAAEGLNLQTADLLINFDLGWNPMKIEQRIGRIDRIGQKYSDIEVLNMCYLGSVEETVYGRLLNRLKDANLIVGTQQISMLPVEPQEFRDLQSGAIDEEELERRSKKTT